ncbi:glycosyltransferase family 87 protein [Bradyrhizobium sp. HKCCYLR20261]|uniref:glycosyltransferase family 87 protein n=1 Tax=Bradyrhizobium sp. HKCCYLR20261 TaxID=3420760 RepID=UPI003EBB3A26
MPIARKPLATPLVIAGSVVAGALYAYFIGEDINWDWQNYHDYAGFALVNGRFDVDVAPGGFQSFLNPLIYLLPYVVRHSLPAPWWGIALGALHGLNLAAVYWVTRVLLQRSADAVTLGAALLIAALSPMALSEVGTSFADIVTTIPILAALALMFERDDNEVRARHLLLAGLLIGAATGLKLTNATFLIGAGVSLLLVAQPLRALVTFGAASAAGVIVTAGPWAWKMARDFGSPLFPFYNTIFRSPEAPLVSIVDTRFMPQGLLDALAYPFYWVVGIHPSSEWSFRDPRFAIVIVLLIALVATGVVQRREVLALRERRLIIFFWVSYVLWMLAFSIQRYLMPLELLAAPLIVLLLIRLVEAWRGRTVASPSPRVMQAVTIATALAIALASQPTDWMRRPWSDPYRPQLAEPLQQPATFLLLQKPLGYVTSFVPRGSRVYQLSELVVPIVPGGILDRRVRDGLAAPLPGGIWALYYADSPADNPPRLDVLGDYDLKLDGSRTCERIQAADGTDIMACPVISAAGPAASTAGLKPDHGAN